MLTVGSGAVRTCQGISRRELLRVAGLGFAGLTLADVLRRDAQSRPVAGSRSGRDRSCIFLWLEGGPSHFETFDPKPDAPETIRGPYGAIRTKVPGIQISELLPQLARQMDRCAIIRSLTHSSSDHSPIPMLTGFPGETTSYGAIVARLAGFTNPMPPYVHVGSKLAVGGGKLGAP